MRTHSPSPVPDTGSGETLPARPPWAGVTKEDRGLGFPEGRTELRSAKSVLGLAVLLLLAFGVFLYLGILPRFRGSQALADQVVRQATKAPVVTVVPATRSKATVQLALPGTATALMEAPIYARASGYISKRLVDIGDRVTAGQLLAIIEAPDLDQQVDQARASLQQSESALLQVQAQAQLARVTWERYQSLLEDGAISRQDADTAEANAKVAQANIQAAQDTINANKANLSRLLRLQGYERVTAPFAGFVTARNIDVGSLISASGSSLGATTPASAALPTTGTGAQGGEMFDVTNLDRLRIFVSVPESDARYITIGQAVELHFDSLPGRVFRGDVVRTTHAVDPATRTLLTEVQVENRNGALLPGTYATVTFNEVRATPPIVIPGDCVITRSTGTLVAMVRNDVVHLQPVVLGRDYGAQTEVREGLREGDLVIINPGDSAQEGARVSARRLASTSENSPSPGQPPSQPAGAKQSAQRPSGPR
ncbi:MAG: efflux RND transporter periplasmic adaptor subunit [Candidatus Methylomirabilales bacterium]